MPRKARAAWEGMTVEDVNRAVKEHLRADRLYIVAVTKDAEALKRALRD